MAATADALYRLPSRIVGDIQGVGEELQKAGPVGQVLGAPLTIAGAGLRAGMEAFPLGHLTGLPFPEIPLAARRMPFAERAATAEAIRRLTPPDLAEAQALGVTGSEGEWKGTVEPSPATDAAQVANAKAAQAAAEEAPGDVAATPPVDLHVRARQIEPDVFKTYDNLGMQRDALRRQIDDFDDMRRDGRSPAIDALDQQIAAARVARLEAESQQDRRALNDAITELEGRRAGLAEALPETGDTPEMTAARARMQALDYQMRDLAPQVSDAYRRAATEVPPEEPPTAAPIEPVSEAAAPPPAAPPPEAGVVFPDIREDVRAKLIAAGRAAEEADAASALIAAHYDARAARFEGRLGTAEQLYATEAPQVEAAARGRVGEQGRTVLRDGQATIRLMANADASTFVHETAHTWLEELLRDAAHEAAPADLVADAGAVRDWLKVEKGEAIPTRGHEKFARGFERYLMEGRAPSTALARAFDQFKQWLTRIYETVGRLRAPITDDIRDVYGRLLALPGREPVIGRDMEIPRSFGDEHAELAERTAPEYAHGAADRVRAESDKVALEQAPGVYDELAGSRSGPGISEPAPGGRPPEGGGPGGNAAPPGPGYEPARAFETVGAVGEGGGAATPQGLGLGAATETFERPGTPAPSHFTDKAGNIRLDLIDAAEDVKQIIRETAVRGGDFLSARRSVLSDAETFRLAEALGMDAGSLNRRKIGQAFNAEEIVAATRLLKQSAGEVREAMIKADGGTDADVLAMAEAMDRHLLIQEQVSGITAEAGRALRIIRYAGGGAELENIAALARQATGRELFQLRQLARAGRQMQTAQQISKLNWDSQKPGFFDWFLSYVINDLISGPATHGTYMVANAELGFFRAVAETPTAAIIGRVRQRFAPEFAGGAQAAPGQQRFEFVEARAQVYGALKGQRDAWQAGWRGFLANESVALRGEQVAPQTAFGKAGIPIPVLGPVLEAPSRAVTALHTITRVSSERATISAAAYRTAMQEGLTGNARARRVSYLEQNPTDEMMSEAISEANRAALQQRAPYGSLTAQVQRITNFGFRFPEALGGNYLGTLRPLKFVDPFVAISGNMMRGAILERTPLGIFSQAIRDDLAGSNGVLAFDRTAARIVAGTGYYMAMGSLAAAAWLTDSGPSDWRHMMMRRLGGWMPHGLLIGDIYHDIHRLGVLGLQASIAADLWHAVDRIGQDDAATAASAMVMSFVHNVMDEGFLRGPSDMIQAITDPDRHGAAYVRNQLSSFLVPYSVGMAQIERATDPYTRRARTIMDAIIRKIPGWGESLEPNIDIFGRPIPNMQSVVPGLLAIYQSRINNDPVIQRMNALGIAPAPVERKISGVELSPKQYTEYAINAGTILKTSLDHLVAQPWFAQAPELHQVELIRHAITAARSQARAAMKMENNMAIVREAAEAKKALLHQGAKP